MPEFDVMITLTDDELDAVTGGQIVSLVERFPEPARSQPTSRSPAKRTGSASVVGGLAPSASGSLCGTLRGRRRLAPSIGL